MDAYYYNGSDPGESVYNPPSHLSRLQQERAWWQCFQIAKREGRADAYLAEYEGHTIYTVLVEDAKRLLEAEAVEPVR